MHLRKGYSPKCLEEEFSEVRGSKRPIRRSAKHSTTAWRHPFGVKMLLLGTIRCTVVYQGVATRNDATTREILAHRTGTQPIRKDYPPVGHPSPLSTALSSSASR
jgi:hypothetical protein